MTTTTTPTPDRLLRTRYGHVVHPAFPGEPTGVCGNWGPDRPMFETDASFGPVCAHCTELLEAGATTARVQS